MMADRRQRLEELFQAAADLPESQRESFLARQCGDDTEILRAVEELLLHYRAASPSFLQPSPLAAGCGMGEEERLPTHVGRYRIVRRIGVGGMGVIYEAIQDQPRRTVALKVIRGAFASPSLRRRFEVEAEILGQLRHPGIAQIYEAATTGPDSAGQPYFAMELIRGPSLLDYANQKRLPPRDRLELMALVCDAVQFAHQKGFIHRDLKPANILVEDPEVNGTPLGTTSGLRIGQPKILDFGIARMMQSDVLTATLHTEPGQLLGSLWYMSPEQIAGDPRDLDTCSDVYALGVVLFELLGGCLPYDLTGRSFSEIGRIIREQEPPRLGTLNERCRGDVETIVAKALEKEKNRRYGSAGELAADLRRYLQHEPILARPTSRIYQLRKFARRNRAIAVGVLAVFVALLLGVLGTSGALIRAKRAERTAGDRLMQVQREAAKAAAVNRFLQEMLSAVDPAKTLGGEVGLRDVLDAAVRQLDAEPIPNEPEVEAEVRTTIGNTWCALGQYVDAERQLRSSLDLRIAALGPADPDVGRTLRDLGLVIYSAGNYAEAESLYRRALEIHLTAFGESHGDVAQTLQDLAAALRAQSKLNEAELLYRRALSIREKLLGPDSLEAAQTMNSLALLAQNREDYSAAEELFRRSLDIRRRRLGAVHPDVAGSLNNLGNLLRYSGKTEEAEAVLRRALEMRRKLFGDEHPSVAQSLLGLAVFLHGIGRLDDAEPFYREAMPIHRTLLGNQHPDLANNLQSLALLLHEKGVLGESEALYRESLTIRRAAFGDHDLATANSLSGLGGLLVDKGQYPDAESLQRQALRIRASHLPPDHWQIVITKNLLAAALAGEGRLDEAEPLFEESCAGLTQFPSFAVRRKQDALRRVITFYEQRGKQDEALKFRALLEASGPIP